MLEVVVKIAHRHVIVHVHVHVVMTVKYEMWAVIVTVVSHCVFVRLPGDRCGWVSTSSETDWQRGCPARNCWGESLA